MKGSEMKLMQYMEGTKKRFVIPVYQRNYDWKRDNCKQLFDDLVKVIKNDRPSHFFGSIVSSYQSTGRFAQYLIIDGQQRLTTVSLLMLAMYNLIQEGKVTPNTETMAKELFEEFLVDKYQPKEKRIKLKPVKDDMRAFEKLFDTDEENDEQSNLTYNYEYFYNRIQNGEVTIEQLYDALFRLEIINIELTPGDDPQLIFESLNSTGLALSEGDKIRNYMLMGLTPELQNDYYEQYWNKIEEFTDYDVSGFVRDYLSVKQQVIPAFSKVYVTFREYAEKLRLVPDDTLEDLLKDLREYADTYRILLKGNTPDRVLNACILRLKRLGITVMRPFFMEVFRLYKEKTLQLEELREIFLYTENYLFRRGICDLPTNALNKIFLTLHREIIRYDGSENDYVNKFKYALLAKNDRGRFPRDDEFVAAMSAKPIYLMNQKNKIYILERFENYGIEEDKDIYGHIDIGTYSIEHIMPQTLTPEWMEALGEDYETIHEEWQDRLANLTLTAYNSEYSNRPFREKRDMAKGFSESGLRLNTWIAKQDKWTLTELQARNNLMTEQACTIWQLPDSTYQPPEKMHESVSLEEDVDLSGREILRFEYKGVSYPVTSWIEMMERVIRILHAEDNSVLKRLAYLTDTDNEVSSYVSYDPASLRTALQIEEGIYIEKNTNTNMKISMLKKYFDMYGENPEELTFFLRDTEDVVHEDEKGTRYELRRNYWKYSLERIQSANQDNGSYANVHSSKSNWIAGFMGIRGISVNCVANFDHSRVELYIDRGDREINKSIFDYLYRQKNLIEVSLSRPLTWSRLDEYRASVISCRLDNVSIENQEDWDRMAQFHAEWSRKFIDVFVPILQRQSF